MVIPLGRNGGASQLPNGMVAGSFLTKTMHQRKRYVDVKILETDETEGANPIEWLELEKTYYNLLLVSGF